jgi:hypothetical protein
MRTVSPQASLPAKRKRSNVSSRLPAKTPLDQVKRLLMFFVKDILPRLEKVQKPRLNGLLLSEEEEGKVSLAISMHSLDSWRIEEIGKRGIKTLSCVSSGNILMKRQVLSTSCHHRVSCNGKRREDRLLLAVHFLSTALFPLRISLFRYPLLGLMIRFLTIFFFHSAYILPSQCPQ